MVKILASKSSGTGAFEHQNGVQVVDGSNPSIPTSSPPVLSVSFP